VSRAVCDKACDDKHEHNATEQRRKQRNRSSVFRIHIANSDMATNKIEIIHQKGRS
jgi:hypothetical protein